MSALDARWAISGLAQPSTGATFGNRSGVFPGGTSGAGVSNDCQVVPGGGLSVVINGGQYGVARGSNALYLGAVTGAVTLTHTQGASTFPRIDYVIIRVRDPDAGIDPGTTFSAQAMILLGVPASVPTGPDNQLSDGDLLLAAVTVGTNATTITANNIADKREPIVARGGIVPTGSTGGVLPGAYAGQYRDNTDTGGLDRWSGVGWQQVASPALWRTFTPTLYSDNGPCFLGTGGHSLGRYMVNGTIMHVRMEWFGVRPLDMGVGDITTRLPTGYLSALNGENHIHAHLTTYYTADGSTSGWVGNCRIPPNSNFMYPAFPRSATNAGIGRYRVAQTAGTPGQSIPLVPDGYADPIYCQIQGTIEVQA